MAEITRHPLCWPNNVPRTAPHLRGMPNFSERSVSSAAAFVLAEINRLNKRHWGYDDDVIISTNVRPTNLGVPAGNQAQPADSGVAVYFNLRFFRNGKEFFRNCVLTCDKWIKVQDNLHAIGKDIEAQRARGRWGCTSIEQAFQGYVAIPEKCGGSAWWIVLGVPSTATKNQIETAFKNLAKRFHPDMGGSQAAYVELQEAYQQAISQFA